jgi:hypothetical protein
MNFEQPNFEKEENNEENFYENVRKQTDILLEEVDFIKKEEIIEINPEKPKDDIPVFVFPGWGIEKPQEPMKETLETIVKEDRKVITTSFNRENKIIEQGNKEDIPIAELQKVLTMIQALDKKGIDKIDAIGHSEGGLNLAIAASLYPEKFRNLVFISPAGMIGKDNYLDLIKRFTVDEGLEEIKNREKLNINSSYEYIKNILRYVLKNPYLTHKEIKAMTDVDIFEMTKYLKSQGVGVSLVCGVNDKVFPIEKVIENANEGNIDNFISTKGNHGSFVFNKEHVLLAEDLLSNMARNKKKE